MTLSPRIVLTAPRQVTCEMVARPVPVAGQVLVHNRLSAISAGTEGLAWRGEIPPGLDIDSALPHLQREFSYPLSYGYASVGRVEAVGAGVEASVMGRRVFTFTSHQEFAVCGVDQLVFLPEHVSDEDAVFLASMETAVGLVHDARSLAGERVGVLGLGGIGLLASELLVASGADVRAWDHWENRRRAVPSGVSAEQLGPQSCDIVLELSGNPLAVDEALAATVDGGRVVLGSWYGAKPVTLDLGGRFHRARIELCSSQVSTIAPALSGRWTKSRRLAFALDCLAKFAPSKWITHRFRPEQAAVAYALISDASHDCLQAIFIYD